MKRTPHKTASERIQETSKLGHLLDWLNGSVPDNFSETQSYYHPTIEAQGRIERVLALVKSLASFESPFDPDQPEVATVIQALNSILSRYPTVFRCGAGPLIYGGGWLFWRQPSAGRWDAQEAYVIEDIVELAKNRELQKVVRCTCGRWYFMTKSDHHSCSLGCRKKKHESTPEYKAAKAERARQTRALRHRGYSNRNTRVKATKQKGVATVAKEMQVN